jgi:hypothetical protein
MFVRRALLLVLCSAGALVFARSEALAERGGVVEAPGAAISNGSPEAVVVVSRSGALASWEASSGGSGARWECRYHPTDNAEQWVEWELTADPQPGEVYMLACYAGGDTVWFDLRTFDPADPLAGLAAVERSRDEARRLLDLPLPEPVLNPPGAQLVGVPTWLWLAGEWQDAEATASVGSVSSTVRARPVEATWTFGDGTTLTCAAGTPYDPALAPEAQSSDCTHVFTRDSRHTADGAYQVQVAVTYEVSWEASTGAGGALADLTRTATVSVVVQEAQALVR